MLLDHKGLNIFGREVELRCRRLRYELEIVLEAQEDGIDKLGILQESLRIIPEEKDSWLKKYSMNIGNPSLLSELDAQHTLFSADLDTNIQTYKIFAFAEFMALLPTQQTPSLSRTFSLLKGTVLSSNIISSLLNSQELTVNHIIAAREMLQSLKFLHLNPHALREPSSTKAPRTLASDGNNLPSTLARMQAEDKHVIGDISREMARLVPGILKIKVERDRLTDRYAIQARTTDQRTFSSQVLSDGTLRLLVLLTLKYDPQFQGVLCLEEPENGVDPLHLPNMVSLLRSMATDFSDPEQADMPLRQLLITTHSPTLVSMPEAIDALLFTMKVAHVEPGKNTLQITRMVPVSTTDSEQEQTEDVAVESYTVNQVLKYLNNRFLDEAKDRLSKKRSRLHKR